MEKLDAISDDSELEFNSHSNEVLENDKSNDSNEKLTDRTKMNLLTGDGFCKVFCGTNCKYCKPMLKFSSDRMAINGLYSTWITNNILAMARPSNEYIEKYNLIKEFQKCGIKTIINMQMNGEHSFCGYPLDPSGFSYNPEKFMVNGIHHLNYPCDDYGALPVSYLFDIMKIIQHRLTEGKIAIHCHAGHGRTGMIIACYLIFNNRITAIYAINYIRRKRVGSVQNKLQVDTILEFAKYLNPLRTVCWTRSQSTYKFSLQESVVRQKKFIHGTEAYVLNYVPKIIFLCLRRLSKIDQDSNLDNLFDFQDSQSCSSSSVLSFTVQENNGNFVARKHFHRWIRRIKTCFKKPFPVKHAEKILKYLQIPFLDKEILDQTKDKLNNTDEMWTKLFESKNIHLHCQLILDWFDDLKFPVLRIPDIEDMRFVENEDLVNILLRLESCVGKTVAVILQFLDQFQNLSHPEKWNLYSLFFSKLTHKNVNFGEDISPRRYFQSDLKSHLMEILKDVINLAMS